MEDLGLKPVAQRESEVQQVPEESTPPKVTRDHPSILRVAEHILGACTRG